MISPRDHRAPDSLLRLEGTHHGRTLLLVSCGPSAKHWKEVRATLPKDTVIACVKQAIFLCGSTASLHFFNAFNCQRYFPHNRNALKIHVEDEQSPVCFNAADFVFSLDPATCVGLAASVAATGRFEDYTIPRSGLLKPWGPGIIYEIALYMALFLGFRDVHTVGWDVAAESAAPGGAIPIAHFYDDKRGAPVAPGIDYEWLVADPGAYRRKAYLRHLLGRTYNRMPKVDRGGEIPVIVRSLRRLFEWLGAEGASLTVHTLLRNGAVDPAIGQHVVDLTARPGLA